MKTWAAIRTGAVDTRLSDVWIPTQVRGALTPVSHKLSELSLEAANSEEESTSQINDSALSEPKAHRPRKRKRRSERGARLTFLNIR